MTAKKEYRNAVRSRTLIRKAFIELLQEKPLEKITATDIIRRANINRSTFYAHYPDVRGIMDEIMQEVITTLHDMLANMDLSTFYEDPRPILHKVIGLLQDNQELYRLLGESSATVEYLEQLKKMMIQQIMQTPNLVNEEKSVNMLIDIQFLVGGVIDVFRHWLAGDITCPLETVIDEVNHVCKGVSEKVVLLQGKNEVKVSVANERRIYYDGTRMS